MQFQKWIDQMRGSSVRMILPDEPDDNDDEWRYESDPFEEALANCGMMHDGFCRYAGSEFCDWTCPVRDWFEDEIEGRE